MRRAVPLLCLLALLGCRQRNQAADPTATCAPLLDQATDHGGTARDPFLRRFVEGADRSAALSCCGTYFEHEGAFAEVWEARPDVWFVVRDACCTEGDASRWPWACEVG